MTELSKAARNEIRKLRATRQSNLSVGLFIAGFFVPYISYMAKIYEKFGFTFNMGTADDWKEAAAVLFPTAIAWITSVILRNSAFRQLESLED